MSRVRLCSLFNDMIKPKRWNKRASIASITFMVPFFFRRNVTPTQRGLSSTSQSLSLLWVNGKKSTNTNRNGTPKASAQKFHTSLLWNDIKRETPASEHQDITEKRRHNIKRLILCPSLQAVFVMSKWLTLEDTSSFLLRPTIRKSNFMVRWTQR